MSAACWLFAMSGAFYAAFAVQRDAFGISGALAALVSAFAASAGPTTDANRGLAIWTWCETGQSNQVKYWQKGLALVSIRRLTALDGSLDIWV